jgi:hypothetical protein
MEVGGSPSSEADGAFWDVDGVVGLEDDVGVCFAFFEDFGNIDDKFLFLAWGGAAFAR